jgi:DNA-binding transcriptional MerR regulator
VRIGELAERTGISARMLRYYEEQSLLCPERGQNGYRDYEEAHIERAEKIRCFLDAGVPARALKPLLTHLEQLPSTSPGEQLPAESGVGTVHDLCERLTHERDRVDARIRALQRNRDALTELLKSMTDQDCAPIGALAGV